MKNAIFLTTEDVLKMQRHQVDVYGGEHGLRDFGLLESAIAMPQSMFDGKFLHEDIYAMAAAYLFHLVKNHPFIDGNKRAFRLCQRWKLWSISVLASTPPTTRREVPKFLTLERIRNWFGQQRIGASA